jgi:hypothetical protein
MNYSIYDGELKLYSEENDDDERIAFVLEEDGNNLVLNLASFSWPESISLRLEKED